jgi:hypothetical protein
MIDPEKSMYQAIFERKRFIETFGTPDRDFNREPYRAWAYRCSDGTVTIKFMHDATHIRVDDVEQTSAR